MNVTLSVSQKRHPLVVFLLLAFVISWGFWIPAAMATAGLLSFPISVVLAGLLGAWGPGLAGILITAVYHGKAGLRKLFQRLFLWRIGFHWYLFAILWPVALSLLTTAVAMLLGNPAPNFQNPPVVTQYPAPPEAFRAGFLALLPVVFVTQWFGSSLGEELGWRGFVLPRLQWRQSALLASITLGLIWAVWHWPRFWTPGLPFDVNGFGWLSLALTLNAVIYTWLFNNTKGSLLPVLFLHTSQALTNLFLASIYNPFIANMLTAVLVVLLVSRYGAAHLARKPLSTRGIQ